MIYFLNNDLELQKIVTSENINSAQHEDEMNNLKMMTLEMDLAYAKSFLNDDVDHFGYYVKDAFHVAKIRRVEESHDGETLTVIGHHIFFSDMIYGRLVEDVRPVNRDAAYILNQTIGANTRWHPVITDTTGVLSTNFYWTTPMEVVEFVVENFRLEFEPEILFDGQKVNGLNVHFKKRLGEDKPKRVVYGPNTPTLEYNIDYSEIVTKLAVHGKGEEVGDGYGRRINFSDRNINRDGVISPLGSRYLEDPDITANYGNFDNEPKHANVIFEDIENVNELIEAGIEEYERVSRPQYIFTATVADIGNVNIGDSVLIVRREYGIYFRARVHKISVDLLNPEGAEVVLGDYEHFKETKVERSARRQRESNERAVNSRITQLKNAFDARFDGEVAQMWEDYEQALIDAHAEIAAAEVRMQELLDTERAEFNETFEREMQEAYDEAERNYGLIRDDITSTVDGAREEMEMDFSNQVEDTRQYAEQQATDRAESVRTDLESVTSSHQGLIDDLRTDVTSIDDFIGNQNVSLNELFQQERMDFQERIQSINTWHYNLLRESQSLDSEFWEAIGGVIETDENGDAYYRAPATETIGRALRSKQGMLFEEGETYTLSFQVQTYAHRSMDYIHILGKDPDIYDGNYTVHYLPDEQTTNFIHWGSQYRTYYITFTMRHSIYGVIQIGGNYLNNDLGAREYRIKKPYLTQSDNKQWLHNPEDSLQNLEEVTRRVTLLEDGREEFITRTEYDFETGEIQGTVRNILETVDESSSLIANHDDWIINEGSHVSQMADEVFSKAWLADIHNPNMIPHSEVHILEHRIRWDRSLASATGQSYGDWMQVTHGTSPRSYIVVYSPPLEVVAGETYTVTFESWENGNDSSNTSGMMNYTFLTGSDIDNISIWGSNKRKAVGSINGATIYKNEMKFTATQSTKNARLLIGTRVNNTGQHSTFRFRQPKLELGDRATPYHNAYSMFSQRADSIALQVDDQESRISNFTVNLEGIEGTVADIEGDYIKQSSLEITPEYAQIGSMRIDGDTVGSLLRVSPSGIDAVAEAMRLSGDLYVDGDITTLAVEAIEGNFASLWADEFEAITITGEHIETNTITAQHLTGADAILNYLMARQVFSEEVTALVGNFVDVNAGNIVTSGLSANIILSSHINSSNALIEKLFSNSARIDTLITKTHFVNEIKATSIDAVYADLRSVNSEIMDTNILKADWIQGGNALIDKVFANTAMFERMMAKSGFVRTLNTVTIDTDQLTIRRPDGVAWVSNGMARHDYNVQMTEFLGSSDVSWNGQWYETKSSSRQRCQIGSFKHVGRTLRAELNVRLSGYSPSQSEWMYYSIESFGSGLSFNRQGRILVRKTEVESFPFEINLGRPSFSNATFYIRFWRDSDGSHADNIVQLRCNRVSIED